MTLIGFARLSAMNPEADEERCRRVLRNGGCTEDNVFIDRADANPREAAYNKAIAGLRRHDVLVTPSLFHLAESIRELDVILTGIGHLGATVRIVDKGIDTGASDGERFVTTTHLLANFERQLAQDRQQHGIQRARSEGKYKGRKPTAQEKTAQILELRRKGLSIEVIARTLSISASSVYAILKSQRGDTPNEPSRSADPAETPPPDPGHSPKGDPK